MTDKYKPTPWELDGPSGPAVVEEWRWRLLVPTYPGVLCSVDIYADDPGEGGVAIERIVNRCRTYDDLLAACTALVAQCGQSYCSLCGAYLSPAHGEHHQGCAVTLAAAAIAAAEEGDIE